MEQNPEVVMLIWNGDPSKGGATIRGFSSLSACEAAKPAAHARYDSPEQPAMIECMVVGSGLHDAKIGQPR